MEEERKWCVYCHTNKINGKKYIGITSNKVEHRWAKGMGYIPNRKIPLFGKAIIKYGWNNFEHEILIENIKEIEAIKREREYILKYNTTNINFGYNTLHGTTKSTNKNKKNKTDNRVICDGIIYASIKDFSNKNDLCYASVIEWLSGYTGMPKKWFDLGLKNKEEIRNKKIHIGKEHSFKIVCENIIYNSCAECSRAYYNGNTNSIINKELKKKSMSWIWKDRGLRYYNPKTDSNLPIYQNNNDGRKE